MIKLTTSTVFYLIIVKSLSTNSSEPSFRRGKALHAKTRNQK